MRRRVLRFQGRSFKCPALRERLFDWFIEMRTVFSKISPGTVERQAESIAMGIFRRARKRGEWPELPTISAKWVRGWRREYQVSLRKPNAKFKLNKQASYTRVTYMWEAQLRVRFLAWYCLGRELVCWGMDQKPLYVNEGGRKGQATLHFKGSELAVSKEVVAQSRERVSLVTTVTSNVEEAAAAPLPLGILFKGKTKKVLRRVLPLAASLGQHVVVQVAPKGSYRAEHVAEFLKAALPNWTPARAAARDWRILYLDAYKAHFAEEVVAAAWERGFVCLWHGAGTTGVMQVDDAHLHASLERIYLDMEAASFSYQQYWNPGNISRSREDVVNDAVSTWSALDHPAVARGHVRNGLTNDLREGQDHLLSRDVREIWDQCGMDKRRRDIQEEIREKVESGEYDWNWETIQLLSGGSAAERRLGSYAQEGQELEAAQQEGEPVFKEESDGETEGEKEDAQQRREAKRKAAALVATGLPAHDIGGVVAPAAEADSEAVKQVAEAFASKKRRLEDLRSAANGEELAPLRWILDRKIQSLSKSHFSGPAEERASQDLVRRYLQAEAEVESEKREKARRSARKQAKIKAKLKNMATAKKMAKQKEQEKKKAAEEAARAKKALAARTFSKAELVPGPGKKVASRQARLDLLARLRLVYGLDVSLEGIWEPFREWYVDQVLKEKAGAGGMIDLAKDMAEKAAQATNKGMVSNAFSRWVSKTWKTRKVPASSATV